MNNIKKEANLKIKKKIINVFKVIITTLLVIAFTVLVISCKEAPVVEEQVVEEEKGEVTIPSETKEETKETQEITQETTTKETTAPTETIPQTVEYKGMVFPLPEWSEANPQTGEILALVGNPYGVEAGTKIGQCIKDAFELNGQMVDSIALGPEVIDYMQKKIFEENKDFKFPLPFDFQNAKGIKIKESEDESFRMYSDKEAIWALPKILLLSNIPIGTKIYAPVNSDRLIINKDTGNSQWLFAFSDLVDTKTNSLNFNGKRVDMVDISFAVETGISLLPSDMEKKVASNNGHLEMQIKIGQPFSKVLQKGFIPILQFDEKTNNPFFNSNEFSMTICFCLTQNDEQNKYKPTGFLQTGLDNLLTLGQKIPIALIPANE